MVIKTRNFPSQRGKHCGQEDDAFYRHVPLFLQRFQKNLAQSRKKSEISGTGYKKIILVNFFAGGGGGGEYLRDETHPTENVSLNRLFMAGII